MLNPFYVLKIEDKFTFEEEIESLAKKIQEIEEIKKLYNTLMTERLKNGIVLNNYKEFEIGGEKIEEILNERHILGFYKDKKYFSKDEFEKILDMIVKEKKESNSNYYVNTKTLQCTINNQMKNLNNDFNMYKTALQNYQSEPHNQEYIQAIHDIYIRDKFEEEVMKLSKRFSIPSPQKIEKNLDFFNILTNNFEYKKLQNAYNQIATEEARSDFFLKSYVDNINIDSAELFFVKDEHIDELLKKEEKYNKEWQENQNKTSEEKYKQGIAENSNHDYTWGIVVEEPVSCMKNEKIDTPIFKGNISVERIGYFSSQSLFNKRKFQREKKENTVLKNPKKSFLSKIFRFTRAKQNNKTMRENYYKYKATKSLYDNIYRVTKTDDKGNVRSRIVFSPVTFQDMKNPEQKEFIKNIYFSDNMLDVAEKNGGYAGAIFKNSRGLTISNRYSIDEITVAKLFDKKMPGTICDKRGGISKINSSKTKDDFLKMINRVEREKEFNE